MKTKLVIVAAVLCGLFLVATVYLLAAEHERREQAAIGADY